MKLSSLPKYLTVQKIRFIWREKDEGTNTEARKAKILRNVAFPQVLDLFEFCSEKLQKELQPVKDKEHEISEKEKLEAKEKFEEYKKKHG